MISKLTKRSLEEFLKTGERFDGRKVDDFRKVKIELGVSEKAEGSALVTLGETQIAAGIKLDVGEPFPDTPDQGVLITNAELTAMSSEIFEPGPPGENAIEVARVVDRCIREAEVIDLEKLVIEPGEKVWMVFADIYTINAAGNLFDAGTLAVMAALLNARMPRFEDGRVVREAMKEKLPVKKKVVSTTFAKIGDVVVVDPSELEEKLMDARLTIGVCEGNIVALQKGGEGGFTEKELEDMIDRAIKHSKNLLKCLR